MVDAWIWVLIPIGGICLGALAIYLEHQKKMAMIEQGFDPEKEDQQYRKEDRIQGGLVMIGIGAAFLISGFVVWTDFMQPYGLVGLICGFIGLALLISHATEK
ncbi:hypothetical protein K8R43_05205 [archaeon]|nr:hypothetical protein [archaeon]